MPRMLAPDGAVRQVDVHGQRLASRDGTYEVEHASTVRALKAEGFSVASASCGPARTAGRTCPDCGFRAHFTTCGRCGAQTRKD